MSISITIPSTVTISFIALLVGVLLTLPMSYMAFVRDVRLRLKFWGRITFNVCFLLIGASIIAIMDTPIEGAFDNFVSGFIANAPWTFALLYGAKFWTKQEQEQERKT